MENKNSNYGGNNDKNESSLSEKQNEKIKNETISENRAQVKKEEGTVWKKAGDFENKKLRERIIGFGKKKIEAIKAAETENIIKGIAGNINAESENIEDGGKSDNRMLGHKDNAKKSGVLKMIYIAVFIIVLGALGAAAFYFFSKEENKQPPLPKENIQQKILDSSLEAMNNIKSYRMEGSYVLDSIFKDNKEESEGGETFSNAIKVDFSGKVNEKDENYPQMWYNLKFDSAGEAKNEKLNFFANLDFVSVGTGKDLEIYLKLNDYRMSPGFSIFLDPILKSFQKEKWYSLKAGDLEGLKNISGDSQYLGFDKKKLEEIIKKYKFFKFEKDLGDEKIGEMTAYHYKTSLDGQAAADFYIELLKELGKTAYAGQENGGGNSENSYRKTVEEIEEGIAENRDLIKMLEDKFEVEVWIGKNDRYIYRIKLNGKLDQEFLNTLEERVAKSETSNSGKNNSSDGAKKASFDINFDLRFYDLNQDIEVRKPEGAGDLGKILESIAKDFLQLAASPDSDKDGLTDEMEDFFGTDKNNPDTDGDGYKDGLEVNSGYDPTVQGNVKLDYNKLYNSKG